MKSRNGKGGTHSRPPLKHVWRIFSKKVGKEYHYAYRGGPLIWKTGCAYAIGGPEYVAKYHDAHKESGSGKFDEIVRGYLSSPAFAKLSSRSRDDYAALLRDISAFFGDAPIRLFNEPRVRRHIRRFRDEKTGRQAQYRVAVLSSVLSWAVSEEILDQNFAKNIGAEYSSDRRQRVFTPADINSVINVSDQDFADLFLAASETGLRPGDLSSLKVADIEHLEGGELRILKWTSKRDRLVSIPVSNRLRPVIDRNVKGKGRDCVVFINANTGKAWAENARQKRFRDARDAAGIDKDLRFYDLRGTACTRLVAAGLSLSDISTVMGWSETYAASMLRVYAALDPNASERARAVLNKGDGT